jgi:glycosyltransferase involved in cell wall biosynthesis
MTKTINPLISVIMSVHNNEQYLKDAIDSVLNQTYTNFELLITDDCSTDNSYQIMEDCSLYDNRIKIIRNNPNIGLTKSLNNMLKIAKGDLIARMDGDDICLKDRFEKQISIFMTKEIDFVFSNTNLIDYKGNFICSSYRPASVEKILKMLELHNYIPHPTVIFNRKLIEKFGTYSENAYKCEDQDLWIRFRENNVKFHFLNEPLINYRINPNSVRKSKSSKYYKIASMCIINRNRYQALKYLKYLNPKEKLLTILKLFLPRETMYLRQLLKK